jgi:hypothetical protein
MTECMGSRIFGPVSTAQALEVALELVEDKNLVDLMRRFLEGEIEPVEMSGEFQILCETTWLHLFGDRRRRDIAETRD